MTSERLDDGPVQQDEPSATGTNETDDLLVEICTAAAALALSAFYTWQAVAEGLGTTTRTGPGFFPLIVGIVLLVASAAALLQALKKELQRRRDSGNKKFWAREASTQREQSSSFRVLGILATGSLFPLMAPSVGFVTTLSLVLIVLSRVAGVKGWVRPTMLGACVGVVVWLVFSTWLRVPLPSGRFGLV